MIDTIYPDKENKKKSTTSVDDNKTIPIMEEGQPFAEDDYISQFGLTPSSVKTYTPNALNQANEIFNQSLERYNAAIPESNILNKSNLIKDYFATNYPTEKENEQISKVYKANMFAKALNDLAMATGQAIGDKGGRARVQPKDFSGFQNNLNNYIASLRDERQRNLKRDYDNFNFQLSQLMQEQNSLSQREKEALAYATKEAQDYLNKNTMTLDNKRSLQKQNQEFTAGEKKKDRENQKSIAKMRESGANTRASQRNAIIANKRKDNTEDFGKLQKFIATNYPNSKDYFKWTDRMSDGMGKIIEYKRLPKTTEERQSLMDDFIAENPKQYQAYLDDIEFNMLLE